MQKAVQKYQEETQIQLQLTPCTFTNFLRTYKEIMKQRREHYKVLKNKFQNGFE